MNYGIYLSEAEQWNQLPEVIQNTVDTIFFGHYGCQKMAHYVSKQILGSKSKYDLNYYYISPKTSISTIVQEEEHVIKLLNAGICVSINDWGLFYRLQSRKIPFKSLYLGRLLSKSIADWVWSDLFFKEENEDTIQYLSQNNQNDSIKIDWLKSFHVAGIEVTIHERGEKSYQKLAEKGLKIIGYIDHEIVAISRVCLFRRQDTSCCAGCGSLIKAEKVKDQKLIMYVSGNVMIRYQNKKPKWDAYEKLVLDWRNPDMGENITWIKN